MGQKFTFFQAGVFVLCAIYAVSGCADAFVSSADRMVFDGVAFYSTIVFVIVLSVRSIAHYLETYPKRLTKLRQEDGLCPECAYDLRGTPDHCPECGYRASEEKK